jgi:hypothetical protein
MPVAPLDPALGFQAKLAIGTALPTDKPLDFISENLGVVESFIDLQGMRGTRSHGSNRVRAAGRVVSGDVVMAPTALELSYLLPFIMGGTPAGNNYPLGEILSAFYAQLKRGDTLFSYDGCRVNRATFAARKGAAVQLALNVLGLDEATSGSAFPTLTLDASTQYFILEDAAGAVVVNGVTINCFELTVTVDNLVLMRMVNSQTPTVVYSTDRIVGWSLQVPWGDDETLYGLSQAGVPVSATFTNGTTSLSFTSPKVAFPRKSPDVEGRDEIRNTLDGIARYSAVPNDELVISLDHVP